MVKRLATGWKDRRSNTGVGQIFPKRPDRPGAHTASYTMGIMSFPGIKWPGRGVDHRTPSNAEVKGIRGVYIFATSGSSWPVLG